MSESKFPTRTLLLISLALNVLIVGAAVGVFVSGARLHRGEGPPGIGPGPRAFMGALPREKRQDIRKQLADAWRDNKAERDEAAQARMALLSVLSAEKFDEAAVRAALARVRDADGRLVSKNQDAVIAVIRDLPPQERLAAIGAILRGRAGMGPGMGPGIGQGQRRWGGRRDGMMGPPPPDAPAPEAPPN